MAVHSEHARTLARRLRKAPTSTEAFLWTLLRDKRLDGLRFRRQAPLGPYVADFCCLSVRLVVEVDGGIHRIREAEDTVRDAWLVAQGFRVLRFPNALVLGEPNVVLDAIRAEIRRSPHPSGSACHLPPQGGKDLSCEVWFYHLERSSLEAALSELLGRTLQRGWRALVRVADAARLAEIDERLWTFRDDAFLPHGRADEPHAARQPILLTSGTENANAAQALFIIDGSDLGPIEGYERCIILFDGRDETAVQAARDRWKALNGLGLRLSYWQQGEAGWRQKASSER